MPEPDDAPPPRTDDFLAWMATEMPDVAAAGRRIQRRHLRRTATRPSRWRSLRRLRGVGRRDSLRWVAAGAVLTLALWGTVEILHPFGLGIDMPARVGVTTPPLALTDDQLFPPNITWFRQAYERVGVGTSPGCRAGVGVPATMADALRDAGACRDIRLAEYVNRADGVRIGVGVIEMYDPSAAARAFAGIPRTLATIGLVTDPAATTIFANAMLCTPYTLVAGMAPARGAHTDEATMVDEAIHVINTVGLATCPDPADAAPTPTG